MTAQLTKQKPSIIGAVVIWTVLCAVALVLWWSVSAISTVPTNDLAAVLVIGVVFLAGLVLLFTMQAGRREPLIYLSISPDGEIRQQ